MARSAAGPAAFLAGAGLLLGVVGIGGSAVGVLVPERVHALLPPLAPDAAAIGGAIVALGFLFVGLGVVHIAVAALLRRGSAFGSVAAVSIGMLMAVVCIGSAASAVVSLAAGTAPAVAMLPAAMGLTLLAVAYAWAIKTVIGLRRREDGSS